MKHIYKIYVIVVNTESATAIKEENKKWMYDWNFFLHYILDD